MFSPHAFDGEEAGESPFWKFTYQHEVAHWVRWQSSSIGLLLSALQRARGLTAYKALCGLDTRTRAQIIYEARNGAPIWTLESGYAPGFAGEDFALSGQFWLDQYIAYQVLLDDSALGRFRCPEESFSCAIADAWLAFSTFPNIMGHPGNAVAENIFTGRIESVVRFGYRLTTRSLFECASTLDELRPGEKHAEDVWRDQVRMINYKLEDEAYGGPWQVANRMCPDGTNAKMVQLAVHIALNPPLPFWDENVKNLSWSDLYPPARFIKVYEYISRFPKSLHEVFDKNSLEDAVEILIGIIRQNSGVPYAKALVVEGLNA
jgi:hypothetical protein